MEHYQTKQEILKLSNHVLDLDKPDREIDAVVGRIFGWEQQCDPRWGIGAPHWWKDGKCNAEILRQCYHGASGSLPPFTASTDAAMTLIPKDVFLMIDTEDRKTYLSGYRGSPFDRAYEAYYLTNLPTGIVVTALRYHASAIGERSQAEETAILLP